MGAQARGGYNGCSEPLLRRGRCLRGPGFQLLGQGRSFTIQSYHDFVTKAEVKSFSLDEPEVDVIGETAVAQYRWTMTYVLSGNEYTEHGHDVFALSKPDGQWRVVWRAMLAEPSS
ncbi:MAG: hypothetical protein ACR2IV_16585 [Bryobacteraceae bacterium]